MPIKSRQFTDRKSAKEFADANNSKVERFNDPSGYFKYIVRLTESETKDKNLNDYLSEVREMIKEIKKNTWFFLKNMI